MYALDIRTEESEEDDSGRRRHAWLGGLSSPKLACSETRGCLPLFCLQGVFSRHRWASFPTTVGKEAPEPAQFAGCPGFGRGDPWILGVGAPLVPSPPSLPGTLTIRSGGGVLRMKHLIWPFSPWRACWVCVLEMMGGPVGKMTSCWGGRRGKAPAGTLFGEFGSIFTNPNIQKTFTEGLCMQHRVWGRGPEDKLVINLSRDPE